ncbi:hypothetical protein [Flavobacterium selenitireducens]|uniref:hypothetical protein n=1 Tax=Flavobacterium selenitireducens TaxID=2722704 RepID=UPI00168AF801|nr:hypothetical protein [Flavobacterium selenitireducens]MBD3582448.1 hypothetical protein [Flavobacterium selenitireducens]
MNTKKILLLTAAIIVAILSLAFFAVKNVVENIASNNDCGMFNLDHIEMRAAVDIPSNKTVNCNYDELKKRNTTIFDLDKQTVDLGEYIRKFDFKQVAAAPANFAEFDARGVSGASRSTLYLRQGQTPTTAYQMLLDTKSGRLWVDLHYLNE